RVSRDWSSDVCSSDLIVYGSVLLLPVLVVVLMLRIRPVGGAGSGDGYHLRDALEGLRFVIRNKPLLGAISLDLFAVLLGGATALDRKGVVQGTGLGAG